MIHLWIKLYVSEICFNYPTVAVVKWVETILTKNWLLLKFGTHAERVPKNETLLLWNFKGSCQCTKHWLSPEVASGRGSGGQDSCGITKGNTGIEAKHDSFMKWYPVREFAVLIEALPGEVTSNDFIDNRDIGSRSHQMWPEKTKIRKMIRLGRLMHKHLSLPPR